MEKKQTAVEWLIEQIENNPDMELYAESQRIKSQALQMEKEQIMTAFHCGECWSADYFYPDKPEIASEENYYKEMFSGSSGKPNTH